MRAIHRESVLVAARSNDRRRLLVVLRQRIADVVASPDCPARDLAALTRRLSALSDEIAGIDKRRELDALSADGDAWEQWTDRR